MPERRRTPLPERTVLVLAVVALVVLCLGLPRALMVCTRPCCGGHVKLSTACEARQNLAQLVGEVAACGCCPACADHGASEGVRNSSRGCGGCFHVALGVDLGLPPCPPDLAAEAGGFERIDLFVLAPPLHDPAAAIHPPSRAPPRCDQRTAMLASTVLRL